MSLLLGGKGSKGYSRGALRRYWNAMTVRATSPVDIVCVGDSITEGQQASVVGARWPDLLAGHLKTRFDPGHDTAQYRPSKFGVVFTNPANPVTIGGSGTTLDEAYGLGRRSVDLFASGSGTLTLTFSGTGYRIWYTQAASLGSFTHAVDGGSATTVSTTTSPLLGGRSVAVGGLADTSHTLVIAATVGGVIIEGITTYDGNESSGIRIYEGGHGGYRTNHYVDGSNPHWIDTLAAIDPDLVLIMLGTNDYSLGTNSVATVVSNLTTLIANIRAVSSPSILLQMAFQSHVPSFTETWSAYVTAVAALAATDGDIRFFSHVDSFGGYIDPPGGGLVDGDRVHASDAGNAVMAANLAAILT